MKRRTPHWIRHTHLFDDPEYECSVCGKLFSNSASCCPAFSMAVKAAYARISAEELFPSKLERILQ